MGIAEILQKGLANIYRGSQVGNYKVEFFIFIFIKKEDQRNRDRFIAWYANIEYVKMRQCSR